MTGPTPTDRWNITPAAMLVALAALASVFADADVLTQSMSYDKDPGLATALRDSQSLLPHVFIIASILAGYRRIGDVVAILIGIGGALFCAVMALLTQQGSYGLAGALQVVMLLAAVVDLRTRSTSERVRWFQPIAAGVVAALVWWAGLGMLRAKHLEEFARRSRAAEDGGAAVRSAHVDTPSWMARANLSDLLSLAKCIEEFRGDSVGGPYPVSLEQLQKWAMAPPPDKRTGCSGLLQPADSARVLMGFTNHSQIRYVPPTGRADPLRARGFTLENEATWQTADEPVKLDAAGTRSYLIDKAGAIHVTAEHRRATKADHTLPACPAVVAYGQPECSPYTPEERWGVRAKSPRPPPS